jgi:hypothetical protein
MGRARIYPWRKMHLSRAPSIAPGTFFVAQSWVDSITNMAGFNLRQAQLSIALRDVRLVSEVLGEAEAAGHEPDFRPYVEERAERMRRLRITAQVATTVRVEFGQEARERRARVGKRVAAGQLAPLPASLIGPERLPAEAFLPETIEKLLAS